MSSIPPWKAGAQEPVAASGRLVSVIGGDDREREVIVALARSGRRVIAAGRELDETELSLGARPAELEEALGSPWVITPLPGITRGGRVYARPPHVGPVIIDSALGLVGPGATWFVGRADEDFLSRLRAAGAVVVDLLASDELAVLNSIPSAEGALQAAIEMSPFCLHGSVSLVLGFGRVGQTLAWMLRGVGSSVCVVARSAAVRARAKANGCRAAGFDDLGVLLGEALFCFNTVPALVLSAEVLRRAGPDLTIVDLASSPGGTDFEAAGAAGIRARLATGLPGRVAPKTAGRYLACVILGLLKESGDGA